VSSLFLSIILSDDSIFSVFLSADSFEANSLSVFSLLQATNKKVAAQIVKNLSFI
jgi:hypothetical protein